MRRLLLFSVFVSFFLVSRAGCARPVVKPDIPAVYIVKKGDTLWDIATHFLLNPWRWPELWQANPYIENPHLIYPGDQLHLVWVEGQPQLQLKKRVRLSPAIRIRRSPVTTLQPELIFPYLVGHKLLNEEELWRLPRVLGSSSTKGYLSTGDTVWVDAALGRDEVWWVYRPDVEFGRNEELSGLESPPRVRALKEIAKVRVADTEGGISRMEITSLRQEIRQNDVLLPAPLPGTEPELSFAPSAPPAGIEAKVLGHLEGQEYMATGQVVVLDRGYLEQVSAGHIFQLYRESVRVQGNKGGYWYQNNSAPGKPHLLGADVIGEVIVIRPYAYFSLAVVARATEPFRAGVSALPPVTAL